MSDDHYNLVTSSTLVYMIRLFVSGRQYKWNPVHWNWRNRVGNRHHRRQQRVNICPWAEETKLCRNGFAHQTRVKDKCIALGAICQLTAVLRWIISWPWHHNRRLSVGEVVFCAIDDIGTVCFGDVMAEYVETGTGIRDSLEQRLCNMKLLYVK